MGYHYSRMVSISGDSKDKGGKEMMNRVLTIGEVMVIEVIILCMMTYILVR